jgi:DNA-binding NtrC family response regulator
MNAPFDLEAHLVGASSGMHDLRTRIRRLAPMDVPVLIEGPTGAGKELVAQALHALSGRPGAFVAVNMCAVNEARFEAEFFGHTKGAFTGAHAALPGLCADAHRGTLFLDEIGSVAPTLQPKLLRTLQDRRVRAVGAREERALEFRVLAATNDDLARLSREGHFRADLLYRIGMVRISVPALATRIEDLPELVRCICAREGLGVAKRLSRGALDALARHAWPGNVRELTGTLHRLALEAPSDVLTGGDVQRALGVIPHTGVNDLAPEVRALRAVLVAAQWDIRAAAMQLRVDRSTVYRWMTRHGLRRPSPLAMRGLELQQEAHGVAHST